MPIKSYGIHNLHFQYEVLEILYQLIRHIDFYDESSISVNALKNAWELEKDVDPKDMLFVALTLELNGLLWSGDNKGVAPRVDLNYQFSRLRAGFRA